MNALFIVTIFDRYHRSDQVPVTSARVAVLDLAMPAIAADDVELWWPRGYAPVGGGREDDGGPRPLYTTQVTWSNPPVVVEVSVAMSCAAMR